MRNALHGRGVHLSKPVFLLRNSYLREIPLPGDTREMPTRKESRKIITPSAEVRMLQWKPRLIVLLVVLVAIAVFLANFEWLADNLSW
jgi:hypothetical protein